jgi:hypothetical protein
MGYKRCVVIRMPLDCLFIPEISALQGIPTAVPPSHRSSGPTTADAMVATQPLRCIGPLLLRTPPLPFSLTFRIRHGEQRPRLCAKAPMSKRQNRRRKALSCMFLPPPRAVCEVQSCFGTTHRRCDQSQPVPGRWVVCGPFAAPNINATASTTASSHTLECAPSRSLCNIAAWRDLRTMRWEKVRPSVSGDMKNI